MALSFGQRESCSTASLNMTILSRGDRSLRGTSIRAASLYIHRRDCERGGRSLQTLPGGIHGTQLRPSNDAPVPVVLLIAGSGPTDRNGNVAGLPGPNDSLKMLAEGLAANGIASVRYDKRGIAASSSAGPKEADLRFDTYVADAAARGCSSCVRMRGSRP